MNKLETGNEFPVKMLNSYFCTHVPIYFIRFNSAALAIAGFLPG